MVWVMKNPSILLEIWHLGGQHITSDMGLGLVNIQVPSFGALMRVQAEK